MNSKILLIYDKSDIEIIPNHYFDEQNLQIYAFDFDSHEELKRKNISHKIADELLSQDERLKIYTTCSEFVHWDSNISNCIFKDVNLLKIFDSHEFHSFLMPKLIQIKIIKEIILKNSPSQIIVSSKLSKIAKLLVEEREIQITEIKNNSSEPFLWEKVTYKKNLGSIPFSFSLSRNKYLKLKNLFEIFFGNMYNLWFTINKKKHCLLFLEFNPSSFSKLFQNLQSYDGQIILINERRSAIWNKESLDLIKKTGCKIFKSHKILNKQEQSELFSMTNNYSKKLEQLFENTKLFNSFFSFEGINFWSIIKEFFVKNYQSRLFSYLSLISSSKKIFDNMDVQCIVSLNETGETEKIFLNSNSNSTSILLEHGFIETIDKTKCFDVRAHYTSFSDKIAVWGEPTKKRLIENYGIIPSKILISGSPRHDDYFSSRLKNIEKNHKTLLLAPNPINEGNGVSGTDIKIQFKETLKKIFSIIKKYDNVKIIVKLHPIQLKHNQEIISLIKQIDASIPIYLWTSVVDTINRADVVLVITPEIHATPTIILESMILGKPVMNIYLNDTIPKYNHVEKDTVLTIPNKNPDLEKHLEKILFDNDFRKKLQKNADNYVSEFMSFRGNASENLSSILKKIS